MSINILLGSKLISYKERIPISKPDTNQPEPSKKTEANGKYLFYRFYLGLK
jgi:hypothetical protein